MREHGAILTGKLLNVEMRTAKKGANKIFAKSETSPNTRKDPPKKDSLSQKPSFVKT